VLLEFVVVAAGTLAMHSDPIASSSAELMTSGDSLVGLLGPVDVPG
jgi:hypothetical protein